jgi:predicted ATPase
MDELFTTRGQTAPAQGESLTLSPGTRFGRYDIISPLGVGGMGKVYRARDTQLGRELAIKVLSSQVPDDAHDLERFKREAWAASALNHPNIVTIFELGQVDSTYYIAMELVDGVLLRDMLNEGAIPLQKTVGLAAQIADGLARAHDDGVVHRDLKPENLMVSRDGFVKILDFGLAKLTHPNSTSPPDAFTLGSFTTIPGMIMGTIEYMSPEQANGQPMDYRSDQFSFGLILYEMVTGKRTFHRRSKAEILAAILRDDPEPVASLNPQAPAPLCWLIERCLAKEPEERYVSTRDLARDLITMRERLSDAPPRHSPPRPGNLPIQRTAFIGREPEIAAVTELLLRSDVHVVTLTGPGGIGKTRMGLQVASGVASNFPSGVCFVPLSSIGDPALIPPVVAQALGMHETGHPVTMQTLKEYLQDVRTPLLLLFDNFEHVLSASPAVAELLTVSPHLKVLVTSRSPLHIYGEREFPVPPLGLPNLQSLQLLPDLAKNPAVALFVQRATAVKPNFELTEENAEAIANICTRLDGLPLAIELAAARVKLLSPGAMQTRLESRLQLLTGGAKDLPARQQTLRGAIDWSYDLLTEAEQKLFRRVSMFQGGCTLEGVEAVCNTRRDLEIDVFDGMASLVDKSLLQQIEGTDDESRFVLLETMREYGLERLGTSGEEADTRRAHAAFCLVLAEDCAALASDPARTDWVRMFDVEHDNFRGALEWLTHTGNADWGLRLGAALFQFWETREHLTEGRDRLGKLLQLAGAQTSSSAGARVIFAAGVLAGEQGDYAPSNALLEKSLAVCRELNDARGVGIALNALAVLARDQGELAASIPLFEQSLTIWRNLGDRVVEARSVSNLANVAKMQGDYPRSRALYEECLAIFRDLGDRTGMAWSLDYAADVIHEQGDDAAARALYEESLAIFRQLGDKWGIAACLADLGNLARDHGDHATSRSHYSESIQLFEELGHRRGVARLLDCMACSAAAQSNPQGALRLAGAAAAMRRMLGAPLPPSEKAKVEKTLQLARKAVSPTVAATAWMDGWTTPPDKAIEEVATP